MEFIMISIKSQTNVLPVVLQPDAEGMLYLERGEANHYLSNVEYDISGVMPDIGSYIKNILFITSGELMLDPALADETQYGLINFKEPDNQTFIETSVTNDMGDNIFVLYFDDIRIAKRFVEKKLFGELILLGSEEQSRFPYYPLLKEAYLFTSTHVDIAVLGYLDSMDTISAPSATITELTISPDEKLSMSVGNTTFLLDRPVRKKVRLDFSAGSGLNIIKMNRGQVAVVDGLEEVFWEIHDEIFKIYVS